MTARSNREKLVAPLRVREVRKFLTICTGPTKTPWIPKGSPKDPTSSQKQPQGSPRPPQRILKGSPKGFQGSPRPPQRTPRGFQKSPKAPQRRPKRFLKKNKGLQARRLEPAAPQGKSHLGVYLKLDKGQGTSGTGEAPMLQIISKCTGEDSPGHFPPLHFLAK